MRMRRHDRVWLQPGARVELVGADDAAARGAVADWLAARRPLVAARQTPGVAGCLLALALPARLARRRLALLADPADIVDVQPPLGIGEVLPALGPASAQVLAQLADTLAGLGVRAGVYGSLAWEVLAAESYRHAASDLDLVCELDSRAQLAPVLAALEAASARLPCVLDGELRFAGGAAVAWRECRQRFLEPQRKVLAKGADEVSLRPLAELIGALA